MIIANRRPIRRPVLPPKSCPSPRSRTVRIARNKNVFIWFLNIFSFFGFFDLVSSKVAVAELGIERLL